MFQECSFEQCHQVLIHSKANILIIDQKKDMRENILMWIVKTSYEDFKKLESDGFGLDAAFPVEGVPIDIGLNSKTTEEEYTRLQQYINEGKVIQFSHEEASRIISKIVDPSVYKVWGECMEGMIHCVENSAVGLHYDATYRGHEIIIRMWYFQFNPQDPWPKFKNDMYVPPMAKCVHDCIKTTTPFDREITTVINRISSGYGTVIINTDKGAVQVPLIPVIRDVYSVEITSRITEFIIERLKHSGANLEPHRPSEGTITFLDRATIEINNFSAKNGLIKFKLDLKRSGTKRKSIRPFGHIIVPVFYNKSLDVELDLSQIDLTKNVFCLSGLESGYGIKDLCFNGTEIESLIMQQFENTKKYYNKIKSEDTAG
ncbi:hypothetical protein [Paenibacillus glucanolyticus]|uniref:hypothetical protein n=1 Tax=Paenibacillus glucanolyticus TaxID=59843 RepID=UPI00128D9F35|nr:hypothetical protein [Paenibacillus glucanolyticus]MPY20055.1 hypothetical protein [Paenibacillus glucanolyticus]